MPSFDHAFLAIPSETVKTILRIFWVLKPFYRDLPAKNAPGEALETLAFLANNDPNFRASDISRLNVER